MTKYVKKNADVVFLFTAQLNTIKCSETCKKKKIRNYSTKRWESDLREHYSYSTSRQRNRTFFNLNDQVLKEECRCGISSYCLIKHTGMLEKPIKLIFPQLEYKTVRKRFTGQLFLQYFETMEHDFH